MDSVGKSVLAVLGLWHWLAAVQNFFDILVSTGVAPGLRPLASNNLELIARLAAPLDPPTSTLVALLSGASGLQAVASASFLRGALEGDRSEFGFSLSLALFGSFFLIENAFADIENAFDDYELGAKHRAIFTLVAAGYAAAKAAEA